VNAPPTLSCDHVADEGLLIRLFDDGLQPAQSEAVLAHLHDCADCLLSLAQVLEVHGQVLVDRYWTTVRGLDPRQG
jgi:hypothetical protein